MSEVKNILIVKPSSLGDVVNAFPAAELARKLHPSASIDWLVNAQLVPLVEYLPFVRERIPFPRRELGSPVTFAPSFARLVRRLRRTRYDLVLDMQGLLRSAFFARIAACGVCAGFASPKERLSGVFYNLRAVVPPGCVHAVEKNARLAAGALGAEFSVPGLDLPVIDKYAGPVAKKLRGSGIADDDIVVGIVPGARWASKAWPPHFFSDVINAVSSAVREAKFVILGSAEDSAVATEIMGACPRGGVVSMTGKTGVGELVELVRRCRTLVTNDSGPMHVAAILNRPVCALFGPTDSARTGPYGAAHRVFQAEIECARCLRRACPSGKYQCHSAVRSGDVAKAAISNITGGEK